MCKIMLRSKEQVRNDSMIMLTYELANAGRSLSIRICIQMHKVCRPYQFRLSQSCPLYRRYLQLVFPTQQVLRIPFSSISSLQLLIDRSMVRRSSGETSVSLRGEDDENCKCKCENECEDEDKISRLIRSEQKRAEQKRAEDLRAEESR